MTEPKILSIHTFQSLENSLKTVFSADSIREKFHSAKKGNRVAYHIGFLCRDAERSARVREIRKMVSEWESLGLASLVQRKLGNYRYEYFVVAK